MKIKKCINCKAYNGRWMTIIHSCNHVYRGRPNVKQTKSEKNKHLFPQHFTKHGNRIGKDHKWKRGTPKLGEKTNGRE